MVCEFRFASRGKGGRKRRTSRHGPSTLLLPYIQIAQSSMGFGKEDFGLNVSSLPLASPPSNHQPRQPFLTLTLVAHTSPAGLSGSFFPPIVSISPVHSCFDDSSPAIANESIRLTRWDQDQKSSSSASEGWQQPQRSPFGKSSRPDTTANLEKHRRDVHSCDHYQLQTLRWLFFNLPFARSSPPSFTTGNWFAACPSSSCPCCCSSAFVY